MAGLGRKIPLHSVRRDFKGNFLHEGGFPLRKGGFPREAVGPLGKEKEKSPSRCSKFTSRTDRNNGRGQGVGNTQASEISQSARSYSPLEAGGMSELLAPARLTRQKLFAILYGQLWAKSPL